MDTAQWPQEIVVKPIEEIVTNTYQKSADSIERKLTRPPQKDQQALNCPRCNSINTKFCYYNNYSLTQPRYFCKTCRRYWTEGGSLRNIPVGGGSRKNKRSSLSSSSSSSSTSKSTRLPDLVQPVTQTQNHMINQPPQDLNLAFSAQDHQFKNIMTDLIQVPHNIEKNNISPNSTSNNTTSQLSALELITGLTSRGAFNSFMPMSVPDPNGAVYNTTGFPLVSEFKPTLNFSLDGLTSGYGNAQETNGRLLFPFENLKQVHDQHNNKEQGEPTGYWTGMLGGGSCGLYVKLEYCDQPPHALI